MRASNSVAAVLAEDVNKEKQNDIILNFERSDDVARRFKGRDHRI